MKNFLRNILLVVVAGVSFHASAQTQSHPLDTIYFYKSWAQMLYMEPSAYIVNPVIYADSDCEIYIETGNDEVNQMIEDEYIAFSRDAETFYINSNYLKKEFSGDVRVHEGFVPLFFNDKVAFIISYGPLTVKDVLFGNSGDEGITNRNVDYYNINFLNNSVNRVTHEYLSLLLEDYHDLKMRYEGMKDYKKDYIIEDYFFKYIDRATDDFMHPFILDLVE